MPRPLKRNALIVFGLAIILSWSFMFAKHDPRLRAIIRFGDDPYDAVGSFGTIVGMLIALLSLVRAFRPYRKQSPTKAQCVYLVRSQILANSTQSTLKPNNFLASFRKTPMSSDLSERWSFEAVRSNEVAIRSRFRMQMPASPRGSAGISSNG